MSDPKDAADAAIAGAQPNATRRVVVSAADLPLHCPLPGERLWDSHPRVYLPLQDGEQACPYCGTLYTLAAPNHPPPAESPPSR